MLGALALISTGNVMAAIDWSHTQILGETETYDHLNLPGRDYSGSFSDTGTFTLDSAGSVSVSIVDSQLAQDAPEGVVYNLNISDFAVKDSNGYTLWSTGVGGDLINAVFTINGLVAGSYELVFDGLASGDWGGSYNVTVSSVPLPAAAWLFGTAIIGFAAFSARRSV
jgi:hypothetical protein